MSDMKQYTMVNYKTLTADGKEDSAIYKSEAQLNKAQEEAAKVGTVVEVTKTQTFALAQASTWDEAKTLVPNDEVRLDYFNYGLSLAQHTVKKDLMEDAEWPGVDGVYDLLADVQQPKEKRVADPLASSRRALKSLWAKMNPGAPEVTDAEINAVLAQFAGAAAEQSA